MTVSKGKSRRRREKNGILTATEGKTLNLGYQFSAVFHDHFKTLLPLPLDDIRAVSRNLHKPDKLITMSRLKTWMIALSALFWASHEPKIHVFLCEKML